VFATVITFFSGTAIKFAAKLTVFIPRIAAMIYGDGASLVWFACWKFLRPRRSGQQRESEDKEMGFQGFSTTTQP
jgi:hypothetical protein